MTRPFPPPRRRTAALVATLTAVLLAGCAGVPAPLTFPAAAPPPPATAGAVAPAPVIAPAARPVVTGPVVPGPVTARPAPAGPVAQPAAQGPIVVLNNRGGNVVQMMAYRSQLAASGRPVQIRGVCNSACTMLTTLPNACLAPDASIGFHAPRIPGTQVIPPIVDQLMATTYRNGIRARWYNEWRHSLTIQSISAREYVRLDPLTRLCPA